MLLHILAAIILPVASAAVCGYPGQPAFGRISESSSSVITNSTTIYNESDTVQYQCNSGYYMKGSDLRRCLPNGLWSGEIPLCDTTLSMENMKSSAKSSLKLYPSDLAMDGNIRTCFYSNRSPPKWWRLDMMTTTKVLSVGISMPFTSSEQSFTVYVLKDENDNSNNSINETANSSDKYLSFHNKIPPKVQEHPDQSSICSSFTGVFNTLTNVLVCGADGSGIVGRYLYIEDNTKNFDYFGLCEVKIFVEKDKYDCGQIEHPLNAYPLELPIQNQVTFKCLDGFEMEGTQTRSCLRNGSWSGSQVICKGSTCPAPEPLNHGYLEITPNQAVAAVAEGTFLPNSVVTYNCKTGYTLLGSHTRTCLATGHWTDSVPSCHPVDCGIPGHMNSGGVVKLLNGSTFYSSMARLSCPFGRTLIGEGAIIQCQEDGSWSELLANCQYEDLKTGQTQPSIGVNQKSGDSKAGTILSSIIFVVLICILILLGFLFKRRILLIKFNPATASFRSDRNPDQPRQESRSSHYSLGSATTTAKVMLSEFTCSLPVVSSKIPFGPKETIYSEILCSGAFQSAVKPAESEKPQLQQNDENKQKEFTKVEINDSIDSNERSIDAAEGKAVHADEDFAKECLAVALGSQAPSPTPEAETKNEAGKDGQAVLALYAKVDIVSKRSKHAELKREPSKESNKSIDEKIGSHEVASHAILRSTTSSSPPPLISHSSATSSMRSVSSVGSNRSRRMRSHISRIREGSGQDSSNHYKPYFEPNKPTTRSPLAEPRPSARF